MKLIRKELKIYRGTYADTGGNPVTNMARNN